MRLGRRVVPFLAHRGTCVSGDAGKNGRTIKRSKKANRDLNRGIDQKKFKQGEKNERRTIASASL
jgi:hypothetical protein